MNSLSDYKMIDKLYDASNSGVKIKLIIRGICCLVPVLKNYSENIEAISIVDNYLEHSRVFIFGNNEKMPYNQLFYRILQLSTIFYFTQKKNSKTYR